MSYLYVLEQGAKIGIDQNRFKIEYKNDEVKYVPGDKVKNISIFGNIQLTTQCINECLKKGIKIVFYSTTGTYFGRIASSNHVNVARQRKQG